MKLWGGRFQGATDAGFEAFAGSFALDRRLAAAEVAGTRAHVNGLARAGVLAPAEAEALRAALARLELELEAGPPAEAAGVEDVHTWVAERLLAWAGAPARKLQTGRSRNEQVALDLRLYLKSARAGVDASLGRLLAALAAFADAHAEVIVPGYTLMKRAQPVSLVHHALAYAEMLLRDAGRIADAFARLDASPLGSGALAGAAWPMDRELAARELGFSRVTQNSLDAVADRDFAVELVFAFSLLGVHLSRWAEDWILYAAAEFGWLKLGDAYATGSSLMPQKKNP
ncbi:MAG: argininosuccinate lyase, partial [Terriglobales bacterium]